eukprot:PhF_6_TR10259/c0_g1_i1/m.15905
MSQHLTELAIFAAFVGIEYVVLEQYPTLQYFSILSFIFFVGGFRYLPSLASTIFSSSQSESADLEERIDDSYASSSIKNTEMQKLYRTPAFKEWLRNFNAKREEEKAARNRQFLQVNVALLGMLALQVYYKLPAAFFTAPFATTESFLIAHPKWVSIIGTLSLVLFLGGFLNNSVKGTFITLVGFGTIVALLTQVVGVCVKPIVLAAIVVAVRTFLPLVR